MRDVYQLVRHTRKRVCLGTLDGIALTRDSNLFPAQA